jgi:small subunit ribosomal protein S20
MLATQGHCIYITLMVDNNTIYKDNAGLFNSHQSIETTMANTAQAKKRAKQAEKSRIRNAGQRSNLRTFVKKVIAAVNAGDKEKAQAAYQVVVPIIDSAVTKGIIHKNKAARGKSRLNSKVKAIA